MSVVKYEKINGQWASLTENDMQDMKYRECEQAVQAILEQYEFGLTSDQSLSQHYIEPIEKETWRWTKSKVLALCIGILTSCLALWGLLVCLNILPSFAEIEEMLKYATKWIILMISIVFGSYCPFPAFIPDLMI